MKVRLPALKPVWYQLPSWYAYDRPEKQFHLLSIHRRGGKDVCHFSMTVQDAVTKGGVHYYLFPTREWAVRAIWDGQFDVGGKTKGFLDWVIPKELGAVRNKKDCTITFPHNGAMIRLGGTDELSFVGQGGASYTLSEFSLHKPEVTGFIVPIIRQSNARLRMNGTIRGRENQLWQMMEKNTGKPDWFVHWLKPQDTKCYCWVGGGMNVNPELMDRIGEIGPNGGKIFNVQDDIDSGSISHSFALQEYLNVPASGHAAAYYSNEYLVAEGEGRCDNPEVKYDPAHPVYTFWDLGKGGKYKNTDAMAVWFVQFRGGIYPEPKRIWMIDYHESTGHDWAYYARMLNTKGYWYAKHYAPWDINSGKAGLAGTSMDWARERGIDFEKVARGATIATDIEICRRMWTRMWFGPQVRAALDKLASYHQKTTREGVGTGAPEHDMNSNCADAFRCLCNAIHQKAIREGGSVWSDDIDVGGLAGLFR